MPPVHSKQAPANAPLLITIREAATILRLGRSKVYELIGAGELEVVHIGRACRLPIDGVEAYVERLRGPMNRRAS